MKIDDAVTALKEGKTINNANSAETLKAKEGDLGWRVTATRTLPDGREEISYYSLDRYAQLCRVHAFGLGKYKSVAPKPAPVPVPDTETPPGA